MAVGLMTDRKLDEKVAAAEAAFAEMASAQKAPENTGIPAPEPVNTEEEAIEAKVETEPKEQPKKEEGQEKKVDEASSEWKHKYEVLIGKYNAEIPRMSAENKELKSQIAELQKAIEDVQSKVIAKEEGNTKEEVDSAISTLERELGTDVSKALNRLLNSKTSNIPKNYEEKVDRLEKQVKDTTERQVLTEKQSYINNLNRLIPDWMEKNSNLKWLEWLSGVAPFSRGKTYQQLLDEANNNMDAQGVIEVFDAFYTPSKSNGKKHDIEEIIEPGKPKPNKTTEIKEKKIYTNAEIKQFDSDVVRGKYAGKDALRDQLEQEYTLAKLEGRVR